MATRSDADDLVASVMAPRSVRELVPSLRSTADVSLDSRRAQEQCCAGLAIRRRRARPCDPQLWELIARRRSGPDVRHARPSRAAPLRHARPTDERLTAHRSRARLAATHAAKTIHDSYSHPSSAQLSESDPFPFRSARSARRGRSRGRVRPRRRSPLAVGSSPSTTRRHAPRSRSRADHS